MGLASCDHILSQHLFEDQCEGIHSTKGSQQSLLFLICKCPGSNLRSSKWRSCPLKAQPGNSLGSSKTCNTNDHDLIANITRQFQKAISLFCYPTRNQNNCFIQAQVTSTVLETPKLKINHMHMKVTKYRSFRCPTASQVQSRACARRGDSQR